MTISIPFASSFNMLLVQLGILGVCDGVLLCFIVPISFDLAESPRLANQAAGIMSFKRKRKTFKLYKKLKQNKKGYYHVCIAIPTIAGPAIAGKIFEDFHKYDMAFYFGGCSCLLSSLILAIFFLLSSYCLRKKVFLFFI